MSVLDRLQFYLMHFMPYPDVVPGRPQGQWVDIPNTHFDPEKGHKLYREYLDELWKRYWNLDSRGKPTDPRIENECRDHLLERLQDRLNRYRMVAAVPEARRGEETRVDMLLLTGAGRDLPVEAKRHFHPDIWTAASTQLQGYAAADGADGRGIYLVFWFGNQAFPIPSRPDGSDGPRSARELESMLVGDLAPDLRARTDVFVFDVSDPKAPTTAAPRKKRSSKTPRVAAAA
jgi:hypothetical protein